MALEVEIIDVYSEEIDGHKTIDRNNVLILEDYNAINGRVNEVIFATVGNLSVKGALAEVYRMPQDIFHETHEDTRTIKPHLRALIAPGGSHQEYFVDRQGNDYCAVFDYDD